MDRKESMERVAKNMAELYQDLKKRQIERAEADSLANVAGKELKAVQLDIADEYLLQEKLKHLPEPPKLAL